MFQKGAQTCGQAHNGEIDSLLHLELYYRPFEPEIGDFQAEGRVGEKKSGWSCA